MPDRPRALPVLTDPQLRQEFGRQLGVRPGDVEVVGLDDPVPFSCARSGNCCTGRHALSNLMTPAEVAGAVAWLRTTGRSQRLDDIVPARIARVTSVTSAHPAWQTYRDRQAGRGTPLIRGVESGVERGDAGTAFLGMMFVMQPDPGMADGDRCPFLAGDTPGAFACGLHRTRAQPTQCALAPLGTIPGTSDADPPRFTYQTTRTRWCAGMREAVAGQRPSTTARAILDANFGADRLAEQRAVHEARTATSQWRRGYQNHHSPLAQLYIAALPELRPFLVGY